MHIYESKGEKMMKETDMNIDYEKLRKKLVSREFITGLITGTHAQVGNCVNAHNATPEQLLAMARRHGINLDRYKIN